MAKVTIYTTPTCIHCRHAKEFFKAHNVVYEEKDVAFDEEARHEMIHKSGMLATPVIDIDGKIIVGFDEKALRELLRIT